VQIFEVAHVARKTMKRVTPVMAAVLGLTLIAMPITRADSPSPTPVPTASVAPSPVASPMPSPSVSKAPFVYHSPFTLPTTKPSPIRSVIVLSAPPVPAFCKKVTTEVINADKVYIALQFGVVAAAKTYLANQTLTNRLLYNNSYIKVFQAAITEYNYFLKNPKCYPTTSPASVKKAIAANQSSIATVQSDNINAATVGDPNKMVSYKPVGLLK